MNKRCLKRPTNYFKLSSESQYEIDSRLNILDWTGKGLTEEELKRFKAHYP